jgi:hypothetical protein
MIITLEIDMPTEITEEEREILNNLKNVVV